MKKKKVKKKSPNKKNRNRKRGDETEREFVNLAKEYGLSARRAWGSDGRSLGKNKEVDIEIETWDVQIKRRKTLPAYLQIPECCGLVGFKQDRGELLILVTAKHFFKLLQELYGD